MKLPTRILIILLALTLALMSDGRFLSVNSSHAARSKQERLRFRITTIEESAGGERNVISDATVEGPAGTDFRIGLEARRFKMDATFLTDLTAPDSLRVRAKLNTRRLYGYSEQNLPLYEEDNQNQALQLGFDEMVVLLPFGRNGGDNRLKIEITPMLGDESALLPSGQARPPKIDFIKQTSGDITIQAWKVPHRFTVEALLLEDGREVAHGAADLLLEEAQDLILKPTQQTSAEVVNNPLVVNLNVNQYMKSRPADAVAFSFDLFRLEGTVRQPLGSHGAGIGEIDSALSYDISNYYLKAQGRKYELQFKVKLAAGAEGN